ncbi:MAG: Glucose 1-dehydrogenase 2 [Candidatus Nomurabacteria bacterium GW2011_GWA2_43_15]|uniref:Glucose 1-dehydrogenase 2 n=1 Tax=Candidatus Nomurabacteria bacterium GW2011_GWA2_43_15 TaxID=1618738 RepID=A0A0G1DTR6_9BACT|nr:MAG: Glucose 1-dehydrogenase 2 [Candidatus Nomurabacteria bacterium GW2011_GWA2_43_15]KKT76049.1 MAG: Glucose 1-dehydrogenase 2 [Parcubacteria group bacterium GW2011_GWF2_44_7]
MNLKNKIVVITGGTKGLGKALASLFLNEKAKVVISARSKKELQETKKELGIEICVGDVTKEKDMQKLANFAVKKFKKIDIWINNAGITMPYSSIEKINAKQAHKVMEVNFFGTFFGARSAIKYMAKQKYGTIVNIISIRSFVPHPRSLVYSSSKWAARGFTEALRMALKPENISVIAVHPGGIKTNLYDKFKPRLKPSDYDNRMEPLYVAEKIVQNLKLKTPKKEIIIKKENGLKIHFT